MSFLALTLLTARAKSYVTAVLLQIRLNMYFVYFIISLIKYGNFVLSKVCQFGGNIHDAFQTPRYLLMRTSICQKFRNIKVNSRSKILILSNSLDAFDMKTKCFFFHIHYTHKEKIRIC